MSIFKRMALIVFFISMTAMATLTFAQEATVVAKVVWINGSKFSAQDNANASRLLRKNSPIYLHDTLTTDANSQAQIVFTDNTLLTLREGTNLKISDYQYNAKVNHHSVGKYLMNLVEGGFRTVTGLIAKTNSSDYKVITPVATMGVRGTDYAAYFHHGQLYMNYYHGTPFVQNAQGTIVLTATNPYANVPSVDQAPVVLSEQPTVFHTPLKIIPVAGGSGGGGGGGHGVCSGTSTFSVDYR